jgi:hypothetical protein
VRKKARRTAPSGRLCEKNSSIRVFVADYAKKKSGFVPMRLRNFPGVITLGTKRRLSHKSLIIDY